MTASQALLDEAVRLQADAVIVHHGYFWKASLGYSRHETPSLKNVTGK